MPRRGFVRTAAALAAGFPFVARGATQAEFKVGLVADAQYADIPAKGTRFYRESVGKLGAAVEHFNGRDCAFCVHLGDLIDRAWASFSAIEEPLRKSRPKWHQVLGNHDFDVLDAEKGQVPGRLGMIWRHGSFAHGGVRFVILDTNDVSTYAHAAGSAEHAAAERELARIKAAKLPQAQNWNGGVGPAQLAWLEKTCRDAATAGEKVVALGHHPIFPFGNHVAWNASEVLAILARHRHVVAYLNGHNHAGAYGEHEGLQCVTMQGMVETADTTAYATATVHADRIVLTGAGREPSRELRFRR
jgi:manganese-dependent ADP-ribose/CDP-alcohol diphosphatase